MFTTADIKNIQIRSKNVYFAHKVLLDIARKAEQDVVNDPKQAIVSLVFSFNCLEAFINETISSSEIFLGGRRTEEEKELANQLISLQKGRESTLCKYKKSKRLFTKNHWNKTESPYKEFELLQKLRNAIIHRAPEVINGESRIGGTWIYTSAYERPEKELQELFDFGVLDEIQGNESWLDLIMTKKFASWCCRIAEEVINNFLFSLHDGKFKDEMINKMGVTEK